MVAAMASATAFTALGAWSHEGVDGTLNWAHRLRIQELPTMLVDGVIDSAVRAATGYWPRDIAALELVVAAGPGGQGEVWISDLRFEDTSYYLTPVVAASSALPGYEPVHVCDLSPLNGWRSAAAPFAWLVVSRGAGSRFWSWAGSRPPATS